MLSAHSVIHYYLSFFVLSFVPMIIINTKRLFWTRFFLFNLFISYLWLACTVHGTLGALCIYGYYRYIWEASNNELMAIAIETIHNPQSTRKWIKQNDRNSIREYAVAIHIVYSSTIPITNNQAIIKIMFYGPWSSTCCVACKIISLLSSTTNNNTFPGI